MQLTKLFNEFFSSEKAGGIILVFVTIISLLLANSSLQSVYLNLWKYEIGGHSVVHWINEGLMTIFFLLIGLELEREIYEGELSDIKNSLLPIFAALGGMIVPAGIFLSFNFGKLTQSGAGIPTATDIAFAIGILSLLGKRVPSSLKIFLIALAMIDDLGAIIVISVFYTAGLNLINLFVALGIFGILLIFNKVRINNIIPYIIGGILIWYFMANSGVHATITGVLLAFAIPFKHSEGKPSPSFIIQHSLHIPVAFFVLPVFALANTGIPISNQWYSALLQPGSLGIILGLIVGKPLGIFLFSYLAVKLRIANLAEDINWRNIIGVGILGGIGFTMSIFITLLAYENPELINNSKISILLSSLIAGTLGLLFLKSTLIKTKT